MAEEEQVAREVGGRWSSVASCRQGGTRLRSRPRRQGKATLTLSKCPGPAAAPCVSTWPLHRPLNAGHTGKGSGAGKKQAVCAERGLCSEPRTLGPQSLTLSALFRWCPLLRAPGPGLPIGSPVGRPLRAQGGAFLRRRAWSPLLCLGTTSSRLQLLPECTAVGRPGLGTPRPH